VDIEIVPIESLACPQGGIFEHGVALEGGEMAAFVHETAKKYGDLRADAMRLADSHSWQKVARRSMQEYEGVLAMREREISA
jgi:hypothetical protein